MRVVNFEQSLPIPKIPMKDPYLIAYMRGGQREALTLATITLGNRSFLEHSDDNRKLKTRSPKDMDMVKYPIEKAILNVFKRKAEADEVFTRNSSKNACDEYKKYVEENNLIKNAFITSKRLRILVVPVIAVTFFAVVKMFVAISHGHTNLEFLSILLGATLYGFYTIYAQKRTQVSIRVLRDLSSLFSPLHQRINSLALDEHLYEHTLIAAVFGLQANTTFYSQANYYFPRNTESNPGYSCSSSSCGSSCGGGGGCGSGCGGCGS